MIEPLGRDSKGRFIYAGDVVYDGIFVGVATGERMLSSIELRDEENQWWSKRPIFRCTVDIEASPEHKER